MDRFSYINRWIIEHWLILKAKSKVLLDDYKCRKA